MAPIKLQPFLLQKIIQRVFVFGLIIVGATYATWQARYLISGPEVSVNQQLETIQNDRVVQLEGNAGNVTKLSLNGYPITIDESGYFHQGVVLENGYTIVSIDAEDRYGRTSHWEKGFVYQEPSEVANR